MKLDYRELFLVRAKHAFRLDELDPGWIPPGAPRTEEAAAPALEHYRLQLEHAQARLFAERQHSLLIVLQALDAGGKDGTIKHVFAASNPQGISVTAFKAPTPDEQEHDFLWRVHPHVPAQGMIAIFNRSHYEDVLVPRVHKQIDRATWTRRYKLIRSFERGLVANRTHVLKFFLHISRGEQLLRFGERLDDPLRNWKISESDYTEREYWDDYMLAIDEALRRTSRPRAPWYVIPANHKWFRNLAISQIVADTLEDLHLAFPEPSVDLADIRRRYHQAEQD